ncbi:hypothetical protein UPYG_G00010590 [Umbra pygmaea]|uniref:Uncharacterized protein n=1 Tax=Umbra pygmaea TaxID=75934 RepID=A0ABD0Y5U1_UMBPY
MMVGARLENCMYNVISGTQSTTLFITNHRAWRTAHSRLKEDSQRTQTHNASIGQSYSSITGSDENAIKHPQWMRPHRGVRIDPKPAPLEAVSPADCPRDCVGSPVEHFLNRYGVGCLENILSGSEDEDVHLESINRFFERLKCVPEVEQLIEDSRATVGIRSKAAQCGDGPQAKESSLPTSNTALQFLSASSDGAVGKESKEPDNTNAYTTETNLELPFSDTSEGKKSKSTNPKVELVIREDWMLVSANEAERPKRECQSCELLKVVLEMSTDSLKTETSGKRINLELAVCKSVDDERHREILLDQPLIKKSSDSCLGPIRHSSTNLEVAPHNGVTEPGQQGDRSPAPSPSTIKKKRRRKKRVSIEPVDAGQVIQRQLLASHSDSEEDRMEAHNILSSAEFSLSSCILRHTRTASQTQRAIWAY